MAWLEELNNNVTTAAGLAEIFSDIVIDKKIEDVLEKYPISIPRYYLSLINRDDPNDPIRKMCVPSFGEMDIGGSFDTSGENDNTVITGMQHKYSQTALILSTYCCAMYCRHCFRKRMVGAASNEVAIDFDKIFEYIKEYNEITNVLVSGGDAFLINNAVIENYLSALSSIDHLDYIRFGTRTPVVLPQRITEDTELVEILSRYNEKKQIYIVTQFNHPNEITDQSKEAVRLLRKAGIVIKNQTVLLKGINDKPETLGTLFRELTKIGVIPYYVFQCRPVSGVKNQFQVPIRDGYEIIEQAKNMQNGNGKCFRYAMSNKRGKVEIIGKGLNEGEMIFKFHQAKDKENRGKIFTKVLSKNECWVD
ncbi:KamA family radical SAM protein [Lachnospiraceae bacterium NSJ-143]|nr:KamA family radical SAM protein [Lachnospiraceae bacterium NSJ-143]